MTGTPEILTRQWRCRYTPLSGFLFSAIAKAMADFGERLMGKNDHKPENTPGPDETQNPGASDPDINTDKANDDSIEQSGASDDLFNELEKGLSNRLAEYDDRMKTYTMVNACPKCKAFPVVCMMKREGYTKLRCRECGHRWEVTIEAQSSKPEAER
jgi:hypothetical protein